MNRCFKRDGRILFKETNGESVLIDPYRRELMRLNGAAADIWNLLDGERSVDEIVGLLKNNFDAAEDIMRKDTVDFVKALASLEMIR